MPRIARSHQKPGDCYGMRWWISCHIDLGYGLPEYLVQHQESWAQNWCFWTVVLEKTLESPLDCEEIQPVHPKGDQSWVFIGKTDFEALTPILWPPDAKSWLIWKDPDAGKHWRQEEKGLTEDEMVGWHHRTEMILCACVYKNLKKIFYTLCPTILPC